MHPDKVVAFLPVPLLDADDKRALLCFAAALQGGYEYCMQCLTQASLESLRQGELLSQANGAGKGHSQTKGAQGCKQALTE
jgi:hypothetical protein